MTRRYVRAIPDYTDAGRKVYDSLLQALADQGVKLDMNQHKLLIELQPIKPTVTGRTSLFAG